MLDVNLFRKTKFVKQNHVYVELTKKLANKKKREYIYSTIKLN